MKQIKNKKTLMVLLIISIVLIGNYTVIAFDPFKLTHDDVNGIEKVINEAWSGELTQFGLSNTSVISLATTERYLYAGTWGDGVFRKDVTVEDSEWEYLGFDGEIVKSIYIDPAFPQTVYVGLSVCEEINEHGEPHSLYRSVDGGQNWVFCDQNIVYSYDTLCRLPVLCIDGIPGDPWTLYATSSAHVFKSTNQGLSWSLIYDQYDGAGLHDLKIDPSNPQCIWAAGEGSIEWPTIIKSTDGGQTWTSVTPDFDGCNACYSIVIGPQNSDIVYAGTEGCLLKTVNGGADWSNVFSPGSYPYIKGMVLDPSRPNHIIFGESPNGENFPFKLWGSGNSGQTWNSCMNGIKMGIISMLL